MKLLPALFVAALAAASAGAAQAATMTLSLQEDGADVILSWSGAVDIPISTAGPGTAVRSASSAVYPNVAQIGGYAGAYITWEVDVVGQAFGTGAGARVGGRAVTGDVFYLGVLNDLVFVPTGYVSGSALIGGATFAGHSLASLGVAEGVYSYSFGDNIAVLTVGDPGAAADVPVPAAGLLLVGALGALGAMRRKG